MDLFPAIDLRGGRCVRLYQGDYQRETVYSDDPVEQAKQFEAAGAKWIHVVDLDAARTGEPVNAEVVASIARSVGVPVQVGGGIRSRAAADAMFAIGVARVVLGTVALEDSSLVAELAARSRVAVGLDVRGREVAVRGWAEGTGQDILEVAERFAGLGVDALVVTQIARDGTLEGPDLEGLAEVLEASDIPLVASGGVSNEGDLASLASLEANGRRLAGAIVGRAIYEGHLSVGTALEAIAVAISSGGAGARDRGGEQQ